MKSEKNIVIQNLRNKITELENLFRSAESYSLTAKENFDKSDELEEFKKQLNIKEIERTVWDCRNYNRINYWWFYRNDLYLLMCSKWKGE